MKHGIMGNQNTHALVSKRDRIAAAAIGAEEYVARPLKVRALKMQDAFTVRVLEGGTAKGRVGDYLVQGIEGELYPCAESIFEKKYKAVE